MGVAVHQIHNLIRGLSPYPGAFTHLINAEGKTLQLKVYESQLGDLPTNGVPGTITPTPNGILVDCCDQPILLTEVQLEGKRKMRADDFLRGFSVKGFHMTKTELQ